MKSVLCHIMSLYFSALYLVKGSENDIDVHHTQTGEHILAIRDGRDCSEAYGCRDRFSLSPIPKSTRMYKEVGGKIVKDEKFEQRLSERKEFLDEQEVVRSIESLKKLGFDFDEKGICVARPAQQAAPQA